MKYVLLIGDGMGDLPLDQLGGKTPLEAASTPAMDALARGGTLYTVATVPDGMAPGSDVANLSLLGYQPGAIYSGRAPLEAASMGVTLAPGEIAFRCNLVTLEYGAHDTVTMVDYSAGHISTAEAAELIQALQQRANHDFFTLYPGVSYRHLAVHNGDVGGLVTVPPHDFSGRPVTTHWRQYLDLPQCRALCEQARRLFADHPVNQRRIDQGKRPANGIWLWGEGKAPSIPTLQQLYGLSGSLISAVDLLKGIGVYAGLDPVAVAGATGFLDTNYQGKVDAALTALQDQDLVFIHVEAPDEASHHGNLRDKVQAIEDFDARIVAPMVAGLAKRDEPYRILLGMDHYTPLATRTHDSRPVPVVLYDSRSVNRHQDRVYSEENGLRHGTFLADGPALFATLLEG